MRARLVVEGFITGQHRSPYHGFAVEFATHREYSPGDDLRHIDWKVWSRSDRLYIKEYEEETNLKCTILLDASKSMRYGGPSSPAGRGSMAKIRLRCDRCGEPRLSAPATAGRCGTGHIHHAGTEKSAGQLASQSFEALLHELEQTEPDDKTDVAQVFPASRSRFAAAE